MYYGRKGIGIPILTHDVSDSSLKKSDTDKLATFCKVCDLIYYELWKILGLDPSISPKIESPGIYLVASIS